MTDETPTFDASAHVTITELFERDGILRIARYLENEQRPLWWSVYLAGSSYGYGPTFEEAHESALAMRAAQEAAKENAT